MPSKTVFKLESLALSRCLVHSAASGANGASGASGTSGTSGANGANGASESEKEEASWFYNCSVLEDVLTNHYSSFILQQASEAPNTLLAGNLIRVGASGEPHP